MIAVVYAGASWAMAAHAGTARVVTAAAEEGPGLFFGLGGGALSQAAQLLFLTSLFAWGLILMARRPEIYAAIGLGPNAVTARLSAAVEEARR